MMKEINMPTKKELEYINQISELRKQLADEGKTPTAQKYLYVGMYDYERQAFKNLVQLCTIDTGARATYGSAIVWAQHIVQEYIDSKKEAK